MVVAVVVVPLVLIVIVQNVVVLAGTEVHVTGSKTKIVVLFVVISAALVYVVVL